jgi:accessory colonization factor AcfC
LSDEQKTLWDKTARDIALTNAEKWEARVGTVKEASIKDDGGEFTSINDLSPAMKAFIDKAAADTWITWIEKTEGNGHPAKAAAKLYAELIQAEGGKLPAGVADYLAK